MRSKLTEQFIKNLKSPATGNRIEWDSELHGFGVRITANGEKAFVLDYYAGGRQRRYTIGRHPAWSLAAARVEAKDLQVKIDKGYDPLAEKHNKRLEPSIKDLTADYLERYAEPNKRASSVRDDRRMIETTINPKLGALRIKTVGRRDVESLQNSLKATPYRANRVLALLSKMFNLAIEWKWTQTNPVKGIDKFPESKRERWLTTEEIQKFREALDEYKHQSAANALRLLLFTGSREGEVLKATWEQFDLQRGVWTKPAHNTKQKKIEHLPLSEETVKLLEKMAPKNPSGPLFPGLEHAKAKKKKRAALLTAATENITNARARTTLRRPWVQACKAAGLVETIIIKGRRGDLVRYRPTVRIHDLRHSFASHLVSNGVSLQVVGKLLGHTQAATTMRYAHLQDAALRDAANRLSTIYADNRKKTGSRTSKKTA